VRLRGNQIVVGISLNILALGLTGLLLFHIFGRHGSSPSVNKLLPWPAGTWFALPPLTWVALFLVGFTIVLLYMTRLGLRMRAVGEDPAVVDSLGVDVFHLRYLGVIVGGILAGMGGAQLSLGDLSQFVERMSAGRGFIALAALIFGKWTPHGTLAACLLFGMAEALAEHLQGRAIGVPSQVFLMIPFALTMVVLAGWVGRAVPPAADGKPYEKE
ncbi:MAG: ABC transporter permease, partial [Deltaproteobacteria bacterium]|nr:ABC transporter permease [Deltaproteobacteria bacterium]